MKKLKGLLIVTGLLLAITVSAQTVLSADGPGDTYELVNSVLAPGYNAVEVPDCSHSSFGRHIEEVWDADLQAYVFDFHIHVNPDDDRCINFDRQRNEIKTYNVSPDNLKGILGETVIYKWKFKLDAGFQPSNSFTHIHQIKAVGGTESSMPQITITPRAGSPEKLQLLYAETNSQGEIASVELAAFKGVWVEATETITYGEPGTYDLEIRRISDNAALFSYQNNAIRMWKSGADFMRPKWGIYRSLNNAAQLRDEQVLFADFSIEEVVDPGGCTPKGTEFDLNPLTHSGAGQTATTHTFSQPSENIAFSVSGLGQKTNGPSSRRYVEAVTVTYVNGTGTSVNYGTFTGDQVSDVNVNITGEVQSVTVALSDALDGDSGNSQMSVSLSTLQFCETNGPPCPDADADGVCDASDVCPGFDDALIGTACDDGDACTVNDIYGSDCTCAGTFQDSDGDGICDADETDTCTPVAQNFSSSSLTHSGGGATSTTLTFTGVHQDVSFLISNLSQKLNGPTSRRYVERVTVTYVDGSGATQNYGVFSGSSVSTASVEISGIVQSVTVTLEDELDGNSGASQMSVGLGTVSSCRQNGTRSRVRYRHDGPVARLYPNPTNGDFRIDFPTFQASIRVTVLNSVGQIIEHREFRETLSTRMDLRSAAASGIYWIRVETSEGEVVTFKLLKTQ